MSDLNRPGEDRDPASAEPQSTEERLREQVGVDGADEGADTADQGRERPGGVRRTPPPPD